MSSTAAAAQRPPQTLTPAAACPTGNGAACSTAATAATAATAPAAAPSRAVTGNVSRSTAALANNTPLRRGFGAASTAYNLYQLPGAVRGATRDVRAALRNPTEANVDQAVRSTARAGKTALSAARDGLTVAGQVQNYRMARTAAMTALRAASPAVSEATARAASRAAANAAVRGVSRQVARAAVREVAEHGAQVAATAARAALRGGGSAIARAAGRFAPGANIAIAALDTASAVATIRDPNASTGKKVCSVITAAGSIAAATNIPIVSQAGAIISGVSSFIGSFF